MCTVYVQCYPSVKIVCLSMRIYIGNVRTELRIQGDDVQKKINK